MGVRLCWALSLGQWKDLGFYPEALEASEGFEQIIRTTVLKIMHEEPRTESGKIIKKLIQ